MSTNNPTAGDVTILGRYPAAWIGVIEAILALLLTLHIFSFSVDTEGIIMAVVTAAFSFYTAYVTKSDMLAVSIGLAKSVLILAVVLGAHISADTQQAIIVVITVSLGFLNHTQTSPVPKSQRGFSLAA